VQAQNIEALGLKPGIKSQTVCKPGSVPSRSEPKDGDGHSSGTFVAERLARPTRAAARQVRPAALLRRRLPLLLGLAPGGVCHAAAVAGAAVRSYRTFSPLPPMPSQMNEVIRAAGLGGMFSVALSLGLPPPGVTRHRASVEPGLSSLIRADPSKGRPSDRLAWADMGMTARQSNPVVISLPANRL
jgi:hypothetical protein